MAQAVSGSLEQDQSLVSEFTLTDLSAADYSRKSFTLTFATGETSHRFVVDIVNDVTPEVDESFTVQLEAPVEGGARIGLQQSTEVTILTNDDAHGLIGFTPVC